MSGLVLLSMIIFAFGVPSIDVNKKEEKEKETFSTLGTIKKSLYHLALPKELVISPFALYCGLHISFSVSEMTRAFAACMRGVEQVNAYVLISAIANGVMATAVGAISARIGRSLALLFSYAVDL